MFSGRRSAKRLKHGRRSLTKTVILSLSILLIAVLTIGGTLTFMSTDSSPIINVFKPVHVSCEVAENFNKTTGIKSNVNVKNTSDIDVYIRVKLVTYRTNDNGDHIGGLAVIPDFTPGTGWVKNGEYYYYTQPVAPGDKPEADLISSITLTQTYSDTDGGKQAIDVMAEAIQSEPSGAVEQAWGFDPSTLS